MPAPVLWAFLALAIGIALGDGVRLSPMLWALGMGLGLAVLFVALRRQRGVALASLFTLATVGGFAATSKHAPPPVDLGCAEAAPAWRARVDGPVSRIPDPERGGVGQQVDLAFVACRCRGMWEPREGRVRATLWPGAEVARGDVIEVRAAVKPLAAPRNPIDPDPRILGERFDRAGSARIRSPHVVVSWGTGPATLLERLRNAAARRIEAELPPSRASLAKALGLGDQAAIDVAQREAWARAGTAHLLSVSGLHVAIVAAFVYALWRFLLGRLPGAVERFSTRRVAAALTLPAVFLYTVWVGSPACAVRSAVMAAVFFLGLAFGRPSSALNGLGVAGLGILLADPTSLYDPGFIMSMGAVAALLFAPRLEPAKTLKGRVMRLGVASLVTSLAATLAIAPVTAYYFGQTSVVAPLSNLVAVPLGSIVATPLAILFLALAPLSEHLQSVLGWGLDRSLWLLDELAQHVARLPGASLDLPRPNAIELVAWYALIVTLGLTVWKRRLYFLPAVPFLVLAGSVGARVSERFGRDGLVATLPYVGQAEASLLELPGGETVLVDAGGTEHAGARDPGRDVLAPLLRRKGIRSIDLAILTHPHPDHLRGFAYLAQHFPIRELWWTGFGGELPEQQALLAAVHAVGGVTRLTKELPAVVLRHGVELQILHPRPGAEAEGLSYFPELQANDNSMVVRVSLGERSLLLAGDIERDAEARLLPVLAQTDILKVAHHGSRSSTTAEFLAAVRPRLAVIAVGEENRFGFPDAEVLRRLAVHGVAVLRTDQDGMISMSTDGRRWRVTTYRGLELSLP
jgi:competence protein ComEC